MVEEQPERHASNDERPEVVFYAWVDAGNQSMPSSMTMRISGGQKQRDTNGNILSVGYKEVRFNSGMLRTSDPETIEVIRKAIKGGETITEDQEFYLANVEPAELRGKRLARKSSQLTAELESKDGEIRDKNKEIERLRKLLDDRQSKPGKAQEAAVA